MDNKDEFEKLNPNTGADSSSENEQIEELYNEDIIEEPIEENNISTYQEEKEQLNPNEQRNLHRKEINEKINNVGAKVMEKFGVPKPIAKWAAKTNGGPLAPTNSPVTKLTSRNLRNKVADTTQNTIEDANIDNQNNNNKMPQTSSKPLPSLPKTPLSKKDNKDNANKQIMAELTKKLLASPYFWIAVGIFALIMLIIIIIMMIFADDDENDIYLSSNAYSDVCDGFNFNSTSLSRDEFIAKVTDYYTNRSRALPNAKQEFIDHAGDIYDISMQNNINPELVVIRAVAEGHSPSGHKEMYKDKNNYWGIGCNNTGELSDCADYPSFKGGILDFIKIVSKSDSISTMMKSYSSLGSYWYNPGGRGLGGCHYLESIRPYITDERYLEVSNYCQEGKKCDKDENTANCVATTEDDRAAYTKYQVNNMIEYRQTIFGIGADDCSNYSTNCTIYAQSDSRWGNIHLGNSSAYMAKHGCAVTALAIGISCSGTPVTIDNFDAGTFVKALNEGNCFSSSGDIDWKCAAITKAAPSVTLEARYTNIKNQSNVEKTEKINQYDPAHYFVIVQISNKDTSSHFLAFTKAQGDKYIVKDPGGGKINNILISDVVQILVYKYKEGE